MVKISKILLVDFKKCLRRLCFSLLWNPQESLRETIFDLQKEPDQSAVTVG